MSRASLRLASAVPLAALLAACGGPSLPDGNGLQGDPVLAPLGTGATWTYRITDPVLGVFEKDVVVLGRQAIPDTAATAMVTRDTEPTNEETAWVEVKDGFLVRAREEDRKGGVLVRVTTWDPAAPKELAVPAAAGFTTQITAFEREWHPDGTVTTKSPVYAFTVVATDVPVTVPAGTFSCLQLERTRVDKVDVKKTYWLAPHVGKVKEEGERTEELSSYVPGQ
jgi:hypothetical protein